jgi:hypothetical protein
VLLQVGEGAGNHDAAILARSGICVRHYNSI